MSKWLLDPGHGGSDPGAVNGRRHEADDNLKLAKRVGELLKLNGESVDYTRTSDISLSLTQRSDKEKAGNYDYFVSLHRNAFKPEQAKGVETLIYNTGGKSEQLAKKVQPELVKCGYFDRKVKVQDLHVLRETKGPAILIETGFIDTSSDNTIFDNKFEDLAKAIARGCLAQVGKSLNTSQPSNPSPSTPSTSKGYRVCIGFYSSTSNADKCISEAKAKGFADAYKASVTVNGTQGYRVYIGFYSSSTNADNAVANAKAKGFSGAYKIAV